MKDIEFVEKIIVKLIEKDIDSAKKIIVENIPHKHIEYSKRAMSLEKKLKIFMDDGFIDRYSGEKLLFPNILRIISNEFPDEFPYQKNWKMSECHKLYWDLIPTYDHLIPIALGGKDEASNILTTSMLKNAVKSNWTIEEVGFQIYPKGSLRKWDGGIKWYLEYVETFGLPNIDKGFKDWHNALIKNIRHFEELVNE